MIIYNKNKEVIIYLYSKVPKIAQVKNYSRKKWKERFLVPSLTKKSTTMLVSKKNDKFSH